MSEMLAKRQFQPELSAQQKNELALGLHEE